MSPRTWKSSSTASSSRALRSSPARSICCLPVLGRRREQVERRQLVAVAEREARLARRDLRSWRAAGRRRRLWPARRPRRPGASAAARPAIARSSRDLGRARRGAALARPAPEQAADPAPLLRASGRARDSRRQARRARTAAAARAAPARRSAGCGSGRSPNRRRARRQARARRPSRRAGPTPPSRWSGRARSRAAPRRSRRAAARAPIRPAGSSRSIRRPAIAITGRNSDRAEAEQQQQGVADIGADAAEPVGRRAAGGGAERRIGRVVGRQRDRAGEAERRPATRPRCARRSGARRRAAHRASRAPVRASARARQRSPSSHPQQIPARRIPHAELRGQANVVASLRRTG